MEKSFRDILSQFLEENEAESPSKKVDSPSEIPVDFASATAFELGGWRPSQRENPSAERVLRYKSQVTTGEFPSKKTMENGDIAHGAAKETSPAVEPAPVTEPLLSLTELDKDSRLMVGILLELGATDLESGVSLSRVKKAYRRLAKKYHPDRLPPSASVAQRESAKNAFCRLQKAYEFLSESLPSKDLADAA